MLLCGVVGFIDYMDDSNSLLLDGWHSLGIAASALYSPFSALNILVEM
jgi:hypothetical protein